jgi:biopolymer transport protein ExbD
MPEMKEGGVNVTPLIDIVMCLIIFFMLVAKIGVARTDDQVDLPATIVGNMIKDMSNTLTLNVHPTPLPDPQVTTLVNGKDTELKFNGDLEATLEKFRKSGIKNPRVILRGDQDVEYRQLELVLMAIAHSGIQNTAYETNVPKGATGTPEPAAAEDNQ